MNPESIAYVVSGVTLVFGGVVSWLARNAVEGAKEQAKDHEFRLREVEKAVERCTTKTDLKEMRDELRDDIRALSEKLERRHD